MSKVKVKTWLETLSETKLNDLPKDSLDKLMFDSIKELRNKMSQSNLHEPNVYALIYDICQSEKLRRHTSLTNKLVIGLALLQVIAAGIQISIALGYITF